MIEPKYLDEVVAVIEEMGFRLIEDRYEHLKRWVLDRNEHLFCKVFVNTTPLRIYATFLNQDETIRRFIDADTVDELKMQLSAFCSRFLAD